MLELYPQAFPEEDLTPVVSALLARPQDCLSLAAFQGEPPIAHVLFTYCGTNEGGREGALLAPLGVLPSHQRQGLGSALVRTAFARLVDDGIGQVFVLGDPAYYGRFGFTAERQVMPPYPIPAEWAEAWQSLVLPGGVPLPAGPLSLPSPWMTPALWLP